MVWWSQTLSPVRTMLLSCATYPSRTACRWRGPAISMRSVTLARTVWIQRSAKAFAFGLHGGIFTTVIPAAANMASNAAVITTPVRAPRANAIAER
jgi:hypothetical protein